MWRSLVRDFRIIRQTRIIRSGSYRRIIDNRSGIVSAAMQAPIHGQTTRDILYYRDDDDDGGYFDFRRQSTAE